MIFYIYTLSDPNTGEVRYIGCTVNPKKREYNHGKEKQGKRYKWIESLAQKGQKPIFKIIASCGPDQADTLEYDLIKKYREGGANLLNQISRGSSRVLAVKNNRLAANKKSRLESLSSAIKKKWSDPEYKLRVSAALKDAVNKESEIKRRSELQKSRWINNREFMLAAARKPKSESYKKAQSESMKRYWDKRGRGRKENKKEKRTDINRSEQTKLIWLRPGFKEKMIEVYKTRKDPRQMSVVRSDGVVFDSIRKAAKASGAHYSSVNRCCNGTLKTTKGYSFKFTITEDTK